MDASEILYVISAWLFAAGSVCFAIFQIRWGRKIDEMRQALTRHELCSQAGLTEERRLAVLREVMKHYPHDDDPVETARRLMDFVEGPTVVTCDVQKNGIVMDVRHGG